MKQYAVYMVVAMLYAGVCFAALDATEMARIEKQLWETSLLSGEQYVQSRETLEAVYKKQPEYIRELALSETNRQSRVV